MLLWINVFVFYFLRPSIALEENAWNEANIHGNLELLLQPDDVDSGAYDYRVIPEEEDTENDVITHFSTVTEDNVCVRECDGTPKTCYYKFKLEQYSSMGYACGNCDCGSSACTNVTQCSNPNCITTDGYHRNMITVNRRYPGPPIYVCRGDRVIVDVTNHLQGKVATLHWHGIFQRGTPWMDGVTMLSQCPIIPGTTFRYDFIAAEGGTHFWHDHAGFLKLDGVQGPLVVREPINEIRKNFFYNFDLPSHTIFLNDWKHFMSDDEFPDMKEFPGNRRIEALLINGKGLFESQRNQRGSYYSGSNACLLSPLAIFDVEFRYSYRFRIIGAFCMMCAVEFQIEDHEITVIALDGNPVTPTTVTSLVITSGERYDIIVNALKPIKYYWIQIRGIEPCASASQVALLRYKGATKRRNCITFPPPITSINNPNMSMEQPRNIKISELKNTHLIPKDIVSPNKQTSKFTFVLSTHTYTVDDFQQNQAPLFFKPFTTGPPFRSTVNNISSTMPSYPLFSQYFDVPPSQLCSPECVNGTSKTPCAPCVHLVNIPLNETVDFILSDTGTFIGLVHPFHLHGHKFYVLEQGFMNENNTIESIRRRLDNGEITNNRPPIKDTIIVPFGAYAVIRFHADNPGVWIFHCHYIYHNAVGMHVFLQVGQPQDFPRPPSDFPRCGNYQPTTCLAH